MNGPSIGVIQEQERFFRDELATGLLLGGLVDRLN
jgi:hypothetical protein